MPNDIEVIVSGSNVKLVGRVNSWLQREEAGRIAWNAPGVWSLDNELMVSFNEEYVY
nr:BON domain-containing protein [Haliscomenobacter sp.]